jgi:hypothetical protein
MKLRAHWRRTAVSVTVRAAGVFLAFALIATARAQEAPADVRVTVNPPAATIGDLVRIRVIAEHDADVIVTAIPPEVPGADQLASAQPVTETLPNGREQTTTEFVIQPFTLAPVDPGTITVEWLREDSTSGAVEVDVPTIEVVAVRALNDTELRPLKPQVDVPGAPPAWVRPAAIAAVAVASLASMVVVALLAWRRWRRRPLPAEPEYTAEDRAREALNRLTGHRLVTEEDFQFYYGALALIIRRYLEERFEFNATALTTTQLHERMTGSGVDRWQARLVGGLLGRSDAAIYARRYPDPDSADHDLTMAYEIVELSRGRLAAEAAA